MQRLMEQTNISRALGNTDEVSRSAVAPESPSRTQPLFRQKRTGLAIVGIGLAAVAAALVMQPPGVALPLLIGGSGALLTGILCLVNALARSPASKLDEVLVFVDDVIEDDLRSVAPRSNTNSVTNGWETLLTAEDEHLLQSIEQRLAPHTGLANQGLWQQVADSLSDGLCLTDDKGRVLEATPAFRALSGIGDKEQIDGRPLNEVLHVVSSGSIDSIVERIEKNSQTFVLELRCGTKLKEGVLRISRTPLRHDTSRNIGVWCLRDITQQKLSDEARNEFVVTATHELRTPLTNLKAYAETLALEDDIEIEQQKEFCNIINAEATRLSRFVDELLNLSRMDGGEMNITRQETDIGRLVTETVDHVRPQFDVKSQRLDVSLPPKCPRAIVDKDSVTAALVNLLGNACKYTPEDGSVRLEVEWQDDQIQFHIEDSGIGISTEEVSQVFDRFFRSSDSRVQEVEGTGLGLAYVREVARLHGGQLTVHSEIDCGSRFTLSLPT